MKRYLIPAILLLSVSCESAKNDPVAYLVVREGKNYVVLTGRRKLNAHDPASIGKMYKDSFLLALPSFTNGTIKGTDIAVNPGYYSYSGNVVLSDKQLKVNLATINTDNNTLDPIPWNGTYRFERP
jgi:hypothetical protein